MKPVKTVFIIALVFVNFLLYSQKDSTYYRGLTKSQITRMSVDELLQIPMEELILLSARLGISIEDLLNAELTVASKSAMTPRESPAIVSYITADEIRKSGARDLVDVLNMVPGFSFGYDVDGVIGVSARGNWGHEGKVLLLWDGLEMNEIMYSTLQFGYHFDVSQIKTIEVIRGPGSSMYGGYAELGVINITTHDAADINGFRIHETTGLTSHGLARQKVGLNAGRVFGDLAVSLQGSYALGNRSGQVVEIDGEEYDPADGWAKFNSSMWNLAVEYKGLKARVLTDHFQTGVYGYEEGTMNSFGGIYSELSYKMNPSEKFSIQPRLNFKQQKPWKMYSEADDWEYEKVARRASGDVLLNYEWSRVFSLSGGLNAYFDQAEDLTGELFYNDEENVRFNNTAVYFQALWRTRYANFIAGGRLDIHNHYGANISPRLGVTGVVGKFHYKALASKAFRSPSIENININEDIMPEHTLVFELETGYQLSNYSFVTLNLFDIAIADPVVYTGYDGGDEFYENFERTGTRGFELEYKLRHTKGYASLGYGYYEANRNKVDLYEVADGYGSFEKYLIGAPRHKISLSSSYSITRDLSINPSAFLKTERYAYYDEETWMHPLYTMVNIYLNWDNLLFPRLIAGLGVYDLLNEKAPFIQPYRGGEAPYPAQSREFLFRLSYTFR